MMDLCSITRQVRREFGLSQSDLAFVLDIPKESIIALESYRFVELDERQLDILAIYTDNLFDMVQKLYVAERAAYKKEQKRAEYKKKRESALKKEGTENNKEKEKETVSQEKESTSQKKDGPSITMEEINEMVSKLPGPMRTTVIASFKAQLQYMMVS